MSLTDALIGGGIVALFAGENSKNKPAVKDRSILFKSKRNVNVLRKEIIYAIFGKDYANSLNKLNYERDLEWNNIIVDSVGKTSFVEVELIDDNGVTERTKIDLLKINEICKKKGN